MAHRPRPRHAPALALFVAAAFGLHVQAMSPIYQAMSTMYNSELSRGLQLGEGSEACCEHLEHVACICDDHEEGTPDLITIDLPETATTHRCDTDNLQPPHHENTDTHVCVTDDYAEEHVHAFTEDKPDLSDDVEMTPLLEETHIPSPCPSDPTQPAPQTVVVVQCNQQSDSSSEEEIVIRNNEEVTLVSGDKSSTDIVVIQETTKLSQSDTIVVKDTPPEEPRGDDSIDVTIVRGSFESSSGSLSSASSTSSSSSESVGSVSSCESVSSSSSETSSSGSSEEKSHQRHCKRVPSCRCGKCMLRRKLQQQQREKKQKEQRKQRQRQRQRQRQHQTSKHKQKQKRNEKRHS